MATLNNRQRSDLRATIETLQAELRTQLEQGRAAAAPVELDQSRVGRVSRIDALQGQAMAKAAQVRATNRLQALGRALARLDTPEYGACDECGEGIAFGRLRADPAATLCVTCAGAVEGG